MKHITFILTLIVFVSATSCGQTKNNVKTNELAIKNISFVFGDYLKYQESTDSKNDKELMTKSLKSIDNLTDLKELEMLINVWMYYDPTDFPSRNLVFYILKNSKPESLMAVKLRMTNKKEWETEKTAPFSELKDLLIQLENDNKKTLELMQGLWVHDKDSLATISISNYQWTFNYLGQKNGSDDIYNITITDKLPEFVKDTEKAEFIILTTKTDTLHYEILGLTDTTFSLMYFPAGKIHLYRRQ